MCRGSYYEEQRKHYKCSVGFENHSAAFMVRKEGERVRWNYGWNAEAILRISVVSCY